MVNTSSPENTARNPTLEIFPRQMYFETFSCLELSDLTRELQKNCRNSLGSAKNRGGLPVPLGVRGDGFSDFFRCRT